MKSTEINQPPQAEYVLDSRILGGCLCGAVRFALKSKDNAVICHCKQCQKAQGAAFGCNFPVAISDFDFLSGKDRIKEFESSASKVRAFCSSCGSPIFSRKRGSDTVRVRSGALDTLHQLNVVGHIYADSTAKWAPILDNLPQYNELEPGRSSK